MLTLKEIRENKQGQIQECFSTNDAQIREVTFTYAGTEGTLDSFLTSLITHYAKKENIID